MQESPEATLENGWCLQHLCLVRLKRRPAALLGASATPGDSKTGGPALSLYNRRRGFGALNVAPVKLPGPPHEHQRHRRPATVTVAKGKNFPVRINSFWSHSLDPVQFDSLLMFFPFVSLSSRTGVPVSYQVPESSGGAGQVIRRLWMAADAALRAPFGGASGIRLACARNQRVSRTPGPPATYRALTVSRAILRSRFPADCFAHASAFDFSVELFSCKKKIKRCTF